MAYKFSWDSFTEKDFEEAKAKARGDFADWYVGAARVGDLCFDFVLRDYGEDANRGALSLDYDLYVGGIDDGYGERNGYPYTEADGGAFRGYMDLSYPEFQSMAERIMTDYIDTCGYAETFSLKEKAAAPLHVW